jgi:voltage-gated potassium channel
VRRAEGLISVLPTDAENVFTVLTARYLNKDLYIISRAIEPHSHEKLCMAGADRTISPNEIGGRRMAAMVLRPSLFSFLDIVTYAGDDVFNLEEVIMNEGSELVNCMLKEAQIPQRTGLLVLAIKKQLSSAMIFNPSADEVLSVGDTLIVLGDMEKVNILKNLAHDHVARIHV